MLCPSCHQVELATGEPCPGCHDPGAPTQVDGKAGSGPLGVVGDVVASTYKLLQPLGAGGMAEVFLAEDTQLHRLVAVKLVHSGLPASVKSADRFLREARIMARLEHPHIAPVYQVGVHQGRPFLVTKYLEGESLSALLMQESPLPVERVLRLLAPVAQALDFVHGQGLVHRDVKPSNIFVGAGDTPWLIDFGVAREVQDPSLTGTGQIIGTALYSAPETLTKGRVDAMSDQYSLALVVYVALRGELPLEAGSEYAQTQQKVAGLDLGRPTGPQLSPRVRSVLERALAPDPTQRFPSCRALVDALGGAPTEPEPAPVRAVRLRTVDPFLRWALAGGLGAALVLSALTVAWALRARPAPAEPPELPAPAPVAVLPPPAPEPPPTPEPVAPAAKVKSAAPVARPKPVEVGISAKTDKGPTWALLYVDGEHVGTTPRRVTLKPGRHVIRLEREGYGTVQRTVTVSASTPALELTLTPR